jgi:hypothetical protein
MSGTMPGQLLAARILRSGSRCEVWGLEIDIWMFSVAIECIGHCDNARRWDEGDMELMLELMMVTIFCRIFLSEGEDHIATLSSQAPSP